MKTAVLGEIGRIRGCATPTAQGWLAVGLLLGARAAVAVDPVDSAPEPVSFTPVPLSVPSAPAAVPASRIEFSTSNLPRFDNFDGTGRSQQRIDMALLTPGRPSFGVTMGVAGLSPSRHNLSPAAREGLSGVNFGLQWRYVFDNNRSIDIRAWHDLARPNDALALIQSREPGYGARVEMQLSGSGSPLVAERGFIGLQLDGGARITLRRSGGRPMVYYRNNF